MAAERVSSPSTSPRDLLPWALDTLKIPEGRLRRLAGAATVAAAIAGPAKIMFGKARDRLAWSIVVDATDDLYADLHQWLLEQIPEHKRRSLSAHTAHRASTNGDASSSPGDPQTVDQAGDGPRQELSFRYDSSRSQTITLDGHRITVVVEKEEGSGFGAGRGEGTPEWAKPRARIRLTAYSQAGRDAIDVFLRRITDARYATGRTPRLNLANRWGGWELRRDLPTRSIDTVALPDGQLEDLVADVERFLTQEQPYSRLGVPWHRGYLLVGPPGTGKSSLVRAIATYLGLDLYYVPLGDLSYDANLLQLMGSVAPRSIVLFEDIDVLTTASHDRAQAGEDQPEGITLSGLLNALDGVATPHGLITFMTTNEAPRLDVALTRPGRMDRRFEISYCTPAQVLRLWHIAFPDWPLRAPAAAPAFPTQLAPAEVVGMLTANIDDPLAALGLLGELTGWQFEQAPACISCGCTDDRACDPPCSWAQLDPPVCSCCAARATVLDR